jgi:hypothetical protein
VIRAFFRALGLPALRCYNARTRVPFEVLNAWLEHDPEKWVPVFRKDHAQTKR